MASAAAPRAAAKLLRLSWPRRPPCAAEPAPPTFTLDTASGKPLRGPLRELGPGWSVRLGDARAEGADVVALRRDGAALPPGPDGEHVVFANGDRLPGAVGDLDGERLHFRLGKETLSLPLSALAVLWLAAARRRRARPPAAPPRLRGAHPRPGLAPQRRRRRGRVDRPRRPRPSPRSQPQGADRRARKVAAVALNTELSTTLKPKGAFGRLVLRDGTRLSLASATCADGRTLLGDTLFKTGVSFPLDDVVALTVEGGPAVYLSELKARKFEHTPYLGAAWPYVLDGSVDRRRPAPGRRHLRPRHRPAHRKPPHLRPGGRYRRFEALVGLDDQTGKGGSARVRVLVDGKPVDLGAADLTSRREPLVIRVDLNGAKELTLVAEFGERGGVRGHVNWANARLVK